MYTNRNLSILFVYTLLLSLGIASFSITLSDGHDYLEDIELPQNVKPTHYNLVIEPNLLEKTFKGQLNISVDLDNANIGEIFRSAICINPPCDRSGKPDEIRLNLDSSIEIKEVNFIDLGKEKKPKFESVNIVRQVRFMDGLRLILDKKLRGKRSGLLNFSFEGKIEVYGDRDRPKSGLYLFDVFSMWPYALTQFSNIETKSLFPSFDDQVFRTTFNLTVKVMYEGYTVVSNSDSVNIKSYTDNQMKQIREFQFTKTPRMSANSFGFMIGQFDYFEGKTERGVTVQVYTIRPKIKATFALETAIKGIEWMENHLNSHYQLNKLSLVALPKQYEEVMDNLGFATFMESSLLVDRGQSDETEVLVAFNVLYAVARQWFGHRLTTDRFEDNWILEGIAGQRAIEMMKALYPDLPIELFMRAKLTDVLATYSGDQPLSYESENNHDKYNTKLNVPRIIKATSVMQMIKNRVGEEHMKTVLRQIVNSEEGAGIVCNDVLTSFGGDQLVADFKPIIYGEHRPLINVEVTSSHAIRIYQTNRMGDRNPSKNFEPWPLRFEVVMSNSADLNATGWVMFNPGKREVYVYPPNWFDTSQEGHYIKIFPNPDISTFYNIRYSKDLLLAMKSAIKSKIMSPLDRLHVFGDACEMFIQNKNRYIRDFLKLFEDDSDGIISKRVHLFQNKYEEFMNSNKYLI